MRNFREIKLGVKELRKMNEGYKPPFGMPFIILEKDQSKEDAAKAAGYTLGQLNSLPDGFKWVEFYEPGVRFREKPAVPRKAAYLFEGKTAQWMATQIHSVTIDDVEPDGRMKDEFLACLVLNYHKAHKKTFAECVGAMKDLSLWAIPKFTNADYSSYLVNPEL